MVLYLSGYVLIGNKQREFTCFIYGIHGDYYCVRVCEFVCTIDYMPNLRVCTNVCRGLGIKARVPVCVLLWIGLSLLMCVCVCVFVYVCARKCICMLCVRIVCVCVCARVSLLSVLCCVWMCVSVVCVRMCILYMCLVCVCACVSASCMCIVCVYVRECILCVRAFCLYECMYVCACVYTCSASSWEAFAQLNHGLKMTFIETLNRRKSRYLPHAILEPIVR